MQYSSFLPVFGFRACSQVRNHRCGGAVESHRAGGHTSRRRRRSAVDQNLPGHKGLRHQLHFLAGVRSVEVASDHLQQAAILRSAQYQNIAKQPVGHLLEYFSIQKHHFQGQFSTISAFSIAKSKTKLAFILQFATSRISSTCATLAGFSKSPVPADHCYQVFPPDY